MKRILIVVLAFSVLLIAVLAFGRMTGRVQGVAGMQALGAATSAAKAAVTADVNYGRMPLYFIPNKGQMDGRVSYYVQGRDKTIYFGPGEVTFSLSKLPDEASDKKAEPAGHPKRIRIPAKPTERWTVKLEFVGADMNIRPVAEDRTGAIISYFKGHERDWKTGIETYSRIIYRNLWPGIDLAYSGTANRLKNEFIVHPGADPSRVRLRYRGAEKVALNPAGQLEIATPVASFLDESPVAWQDIDGVRREVGTSYDPIPESLAVPGGRLRDIGFEIGSYDRGQTLVLDPSVIIYCGYVGGENEEGGYGLAVDGAGNAYVVGTTGSDAATFPVAVGPDLSANGDRDAFVAKVNSAGTGLVYCGYIGGAGADWGNAVAVNIAGDAFVAGQTSSDQASFPVRIGPDLTYNGSGGDPIYRGDAFIARVNASGTALVYCGYIGGSDDDRALGVAVDSLGRAYVAGYTSSSEFTFPVRTGPDLTFNGVVDAFVAKVSSTGSALIYCGYVGGLQGDEADGIAVDAAGSCYIVGTTGSNAASFPVTVGPVLTSPVDGTNAFVAKINATGIGLAYCGYVAGSAPDFGHAIAVDSAGAAYIAGETQSDETSFPIVCGPDVTHNGGFDAFVAKISPSGTGFDYCGYIGGALDEYAVGIAVDSRRCAYIVGTTYSDESTFPVRGGPVSVFAGDKDAFVARVGSTGRNLSYCGYVGGADEDWGRGIAVDSKLDAYITGETSSWETTFPVKTGPDLTMNMWSDAFVAKIHLIPELILVAPIGGEHWAAGSYHFINWTTEDNKGYDTIEYSIDKGATWSTIASKTPDDGSFKWLIPNKPSPACLIRITQKESGQGDTSDSPFTIEPKPAIAVVSPDGGEAWSGYDQRTIQWTTQGTVGDVKIEYSTNGGTSWKVVTASTPNTGSYVWVVPNTPSTKCLVRIQEAIDGNPKDKSDAVFTIKPALD